MRINRQQFNKYLAGSTIPSRHNLMRIYDFFRIRLDDLALPEHEFAELHRSRQLPLAGPGLGFAIEPGGDLHGIDELDRYCGIYQTYQHVPYARTNILIGVCQIRRIGRQFVSKYVEYLNDGTGGTVLRQRSVMNGLVTLDGGFIYILDRKKAPNSSYSLTTLFPSRSPNVHLVTGMTLSVSHHLSGSPYAANIVYERLSSLSEVKRAFRRTGLHDTLPGPHHDEIAKIITNRIRADQAVMSHYYL